jgi:ferredoxin
MPYVVGEECIRCKFMDCVEVCPVDCFREGQAMLVIAPDQCIDCGVCEPECPVGAIHPDTSPQGQLWVRLNERLAAEWPAIAQKGTPPADSAEWRDVPNKFKIAFSERAAMRPSGS